MFIRLMLGCTAALALVGSAMAKPPLAAFGDVPEIRAAELSPDGTKVAFLARKDNVDVLVVKDLVTGATKGLGKVTDTRARAVQFAGNDYVILIASRDVRGFSIRQRFEYSAAFAININTGSFTQLLRNTDDCTQRNPGLATSSP